MKRVRVVRQVKGSYDDASITSTHTILLDKLTIKRLGMKIWNVLFHKIPEVGMSASLDLMIAKEGFLQAMLIRFLLMA